MTSYKLLVSHDDRIENYFIVEGELILTQNCYSLPPADDDFPLVGLQLTGQNFKKSGLPRPVCANQPITVTGGELDVNILEKYSFP